MDIFNILTSELKLATLHDLQTVYNTEDALNLIEIIEVDRELREIAADKAKQQQQNNQN